MMSAPAELGDRGVFSPGLVLFNLNYVILSLKYYQIGLYCIFAALLALCAAVHADKRKILQEGLFLREYFHLQSIARRERSAR